MRQKNFGLLLYLAQKCGLNNKCETSTIELSHEFNCSQQTISRKLRELQESGFIERNPSFAGTELMLTQKSASLIKNHVNQLQKVLSSNANALNLTGKVSSGLGEGNYYMSLPQYIKQFEKNLGFKPFPGTLNFKTNQFELEEFSKKLPLIEIKGFKDKKRTFGGLKCFKVRLQNYDDLALIIPNRSSHKSNTGELIAPDYLREKFKLKNGSRIKITA